MEKEPIKSLSRPFERAINPTRWPDFVFQSEKKFNVHVISPCYINCPICVTVDPIDNDEPDETIHYCSGGVDVYVGGGLGSVGKRKKSVKRFNVVLNVRTI